MEEWQRGHVQKNLVQLIKVTNCSDEFIAELKSSLVLSQDDVEELSRLNQLQKEKRMYEILHARLGLYDILQNALKATGQNEALDILKDSEAENCTVGSITFDRKVLLGTGKLGLATKVFQGKFRSGSIQMEVAVKELNTVFIDKDTAVESVGALLNIIHDNVARYHGIECRYNFIYIATDIGFITLQDEVKIQLLNMNEHTILKGCTEGLDHLHNKINILHKNLKPSNVLLCHGDKVKITDFGLPKGNSRLAVADGGGEWMPPEILKQFKGIEVIVAENDVEKMFTKKSDIFALGCNCFFTLTNGSHPFGKSYSRQHNIIHHKTSSLVNSNIDDRWKNLIEGMIAKKAEERLSVEGIMAQITAMIEPPKTTLIAQLQPSSSRQVSQRTTGKNHNVVIADKNNLPNASIPSMPGANSNTRQKNIPCGSSRSGTKRKNNDVPNNAVNQKKIPRASTSRESLRQEIQPNLNFSGDQTWESNQATEQLPTSSLRSDLRVKCEEPGHSSSTNHQVDQSQILEADQAITRQAEAENNANTIVADEMARTILYGGEGQRRQEYIPSQRTSNDRNLDLTSVDGSGNNLIHQAIINKKSVPKIRCLVNQGVDWKAKNNCGSNTLHTAAETGHVDALTYLLSLKGVKAILEEKNKYGLTPLLYGAVNFETASILIKSGANKNAVDMEGDNLLFLAVLTGGSKKLLKYLVEKAKVKWRGVTNKNCDGILHYAAKHGNLHALEFFISLGADANGANKYGAKPLHASASLHNKRFFDTIDLLLANGGNIQAVDNAGNNLLLLAALRERSVAELKYLKTLGLPWETRNKYGESLLHISVRGGNVEAAKHFLSNPSLGFLPNEKDKHGETALHKVASARENIAELLTLLREHDADFNANTVEKYKNNLVLLAALHGRGKDDLEIMVNNYRVNWKIKNKYGQGIVHMAARGGNVDAIRYFVLMGACVNDKDKRKNTPIHLLLTAKDGFAESLTCLIRSGAKIEKSGARILKNKILKRRDKEKKNGFLSQEQALEVENLVNSCVVDDQ